MKSPFKYLLMVMAIIATTFCTTACGDEDGDDPSPSEIETITKDQLVGTWQYKDEWVTSEMIFDSDGTFDRQSWKNDYPEYHERFVGTFKISNNQLEIIGTPTDWGNVGIITLIYKCSLSGDMLTLELVNTDEPTIEIFKRIK